MARPHLVTWISAVAIASASAAIADNDKTSGAAVGSIGEPVVTSTQALAMRPSKANAELEQIVDAATAPPVAGVSYVLDVNNPQSDATLRVTAAGNEKILKLTKKDGAPVGEWKLVVGMDAAALMKTQNEIRAAFALPPLAVRGIAKGVSEGPH